MYDWKKDFIESNNYSIVDDNAKLVHKLEKQTEELTDAKINFSIHPLSVNEVKKPIK